MTTTEPVRAFASVNSFEPDQPCVSAQSDQDLHCAHITYLSV